MVSECPIGLCIACSIADVQIFQAPWSTMDLNIVSLGLLMSLVTGSFGGTILGCFLWCFWMCCDHWGKYLEVEGKKAFESKLKRLDMNLNGRLIYVDALLLLDFFGKLLNFLKQIFWIFRKILFLGLWAKCSRSGWGHEFLTLSFLVLGNTSKGRPQPCLEQADSSHQITQVQGNTVLPTI